MKREKRPIYVRETKAAKSISAYVVMKGSREVATIQAYFADSSLGGICRVDIWGDNGLVAQKVNHGYGYDKFTANLDGVTIDGVELHDHCWQDKKTAKILANAPKDHAESSAYWEKMRRKHGVRPANWNGKTFQYDSCFYSDGLNRLKDMGYTVITAI